MSEPEWLSIAEAAAVWQVSRITVHRWIKQGRVQAYHIGPRRVRLRSSDVDALPNPVRKEEGNMLIESTDTLVSTVFTIPRMTDEQLREGREVLARIDENAARIRARSGVHGPSSEIIHRMREERDEYLREVWEESNAEIRRRRELGGR